MRGIIFSVALILCATTLPAASATCKKIGPNGKVIDYVGHERESEQTYKPRWTETTTRANGKITKKTIVHESVCYDYSVGSIDYHRCRNQAKDLFEEQCDDLKKRYRCTGSSSYATILKIDKDRFCRSASQFRP